VLLIASPNARSSRYVRDELRIAEMYLRPTYPLWIAGAHWMDAVPLGWGIAQYIDARESHYETAISELVELLNKASSTPAPPSEPDFEPRNPYKGLRAFISDDAQDFFGRDTLINELATKLQGALTPEAKDLQSARLLAVVGPSGSGKSSVVMAGLLPRLRAGRLSGSEQWVYLDPIVPGTRPIEELTMALSEHLPDKSLKAIREDLEDDSTRGLHLLVTKLAKRPGTKVVLLIDQFEELFTQTPSEDERRRFIDLLVTATTEPHGPLIVLLTLRADFYDRPMRYPRLHQLMQDHQISVLPMTLQDLREGIEKPAALPDVRLTFEGDLVGDLLFEVQNQVGALPLLQFTLDQLFQHRNGCQLTLFAYRELGGVKGALKKQAEKTYTALPSEEHRKLARALFMRLIDPGITEQDTTRRRAALSELSLADAFQTRLLKNVADAFITARLLTTNEIAGTTTIEVSHEALIRQWPLLADWLHEAREDVRLQQAINRDTAAWEQNRRSRDHLYRGGKLREAEKWAKRNTPSQLEAAFLCAGTRQRVQSVVNTVLIVLLILSISGVTIWLYPRQEPDAKVVATLQDSGVGSLRWAIATAPSGSDIIFDQSVWGHTITLNNDLLIAQKSLSISGPPKAGKIIISSKTHQIQVAAGTSLNISNLTFTGGKINPSSLLFNKGTLTLTNSIVSGNTNTENYKDSLSFGGGIYNDGILTLMNSIVSGNSVAPILLDNGPSGGGIYNDYGTLTLMNSIVSGNSVLGSSSNSFGGGIYNSNFGNLTLTNSIVSGNFAFSSGGSSYGGGIYNDDDWATLTLTNSTIFGNSARGSDSSSGGGIANYGRATITFSTLYDNIAENTVNSSGGGISIQPVSPSPVQFSSPSSNPESLTIRNSLVAGNLASARPDILGKLISGGYNLIQNTADVTFLDSYHMHHTDITGIASSDLHVDTGLRQNGGPTQTLALLPGSPAIDAVPLQYCQIKDIFNSQFRMYTDQRGVRRPQGQACDIGAYEYEHG
jgi:hypothetical protein